MSMAGAMGRDDRQLLPADLARERGAVLHRALRELPVWLLEPLLVGTRRHADSLVPGALYGDDGVSGCAVGMMLKELPRPRRRLGRFRRRPAPTVLDEAPELAQEHPRLAHIEFIFDRTCEELRNRVALDECEAAGRVGLWMAAEVQAEINLRHVEGATPPHDSGAEVDEALFADTVERLRDLRPWLSEDEAARAVQAFTGARPATTVFVPPEWVDEVESQRERVLGPLR
jgi:hypothetical protein